MTKRTIIFILLLALALGVALPAAAETDPVCLSYAVTVPAGREAAADHLRDGDPRTRLTLTAGQTLTVTWTSEAGGVLLEWFDIGYHVDIAFFSEEGRSVSQSHFDKVPYRQYLSASGARKMVITVSRGSIASLCELKVLSPGQVPDCLTRTEPVDLMLVLSGVSDELDLLGGLLPLYAGEHGIKTAVVFVGRDDGNQVQEAFRAFEAMGLDVIPLFLQREDHLTWNINKLPSLWREGQLREEFVRLLSTYQPKVVVTTDPADTFSPVRVSYTGKLLVDTVAKRARTARLPLQKLYHLSKKRATAVDCTVPLAVYGGRTALEVAEMGYAQYRSEASFRAVIPERPRFTLAYTTVGEDEQCDDLFEHIDTGSLIAYQAPTPAPTATPSPIPTPTPTPASTDTPAPAKAADSEAVYFRQEGEPAEVVVSDYDQGHWEYRSDILSVIIDRVLTREKENHPYCKYVAHVRMREVNSFRSGVSARYDIAMAIESPWRLARNYRAVLAVTGDNINNADISFKGILIRSGILYADNGGDDTMVIGDDMTMRVYHRREVLGLDLLDSGVLASYSFGPILVENGQVNPNAGKHRVFKENPRCGVGMVEPGHFVVIVSDGRDPDRAYGYTLQEFAQVFANEGVQIAYNLDGGSSAAMVFMGEAVNRHTVGGKQRSWADCLMWGYSRLVPSPTDPIYHNGNS